MSRKLSHFTHQITGIIRANAPMLRDFTVKHAKEKTSEAVVIFTERRIISIPHHWTPEVAMNNMVAMIHQANAQIEEEAYRQDITLRSDSLMVRAHITEYAKKCPLHLVRILEEELAALRHSMN